MLLKGSYKSNLNKLLDSYKEIAVFTNKTLADKVIIPNRCSLYKVAPNPTQESVDKMNRKLSGSPPEIVISIGGGSVIDFGKLVAYKFKVKHVAIPTTVGSGSEATRYAVVTVRKNNKILKKTIEDKKLVPDYVILDAGFVTTLPRIQIAASGLDALSHAIEAYWSINANKASDRFAKLAISHINNYFTKFYEDSNDKKLGKLMLEAAYSAGRAINITRTTICHSVSYPLTNYYNIPHGIACAITLPDFLWFNSQVTDKDCQHSRGFKFVKEKIKKLCDILGEGSVEGAVERLNYIIKKVGINRKEIISKVDIDRVVKEGLTQRAKNNPRKVTRDDIKDVLNRIAIN